MEHLRSNIIWHNTTVSRKDRENLLGQKGYVLWFTGLSGSGKSTLANALEQKLHQLGKHTYLLDGDNLRHGLNSDLGFSLQDRKENIRRIGEVAKLFVDAGVIVLATFISPLREDRDALRALLGEDFIECYVSCSLEVCESRDPKKLYQKARAGEIQNFTGISSPYEEPLNPEIVFTTNTHSIDECIDKALRCLNIEQADS